jgi:Ca-activated chloride channel family protein
MVIALAIALGCLALAIAGERLHARRVARVARLAFGPSGRPARWTLLAPVARCLGVFLLAWGSVTLAQHDPVEAETTPDAKASRQLLVCLDVSPSMQVVDAGPDAQKVTRAAWAGKVFQGILDRLDMKTTRITLVVFYSKALVVLEQTTDKNVIANMLDGLPMHVGFNPGPTDMAAGLRECVRLAKPWDRKTATLVVIGDGDVEQGASAIGSLSSPPSIADTIVIGVGDPTRASLVSGHSSRQDAWTLKQVAAKFGGVYHDGNRLHLPSSVLDSLTMLSPRSGVPLGLREAALTAVGTGAALMAGIGPLLAGFGLPRAFGTQRRRVRERAAAEAAS